MLAYLSYMAERLAECHRVLKDTGSIYLHCDPTASHYLKAVMDAVFNSGNFRREIVWSNEDSSGFKSKAKNWIRGHDTLLYYCKSSRDSVFNKQYLPLSESTIRRYDKKDDQGRYKIYRTKNGDERKVYLNKARGRSMSSVWTDIASFQTVNNTGERTGYPTQKPVALLERIIKASAAKGNLVLDPFCGCGTTIAAARNLGLDWVGIDISPLAIDVIRKERFPGVEFPVHGIPVNLATARRLAKDRPFDFEKWAITRIPGLAPNDQQVADGGVDGRGHLVNAPDNLDSTLVLAQVKGGSPSVDQVKAFAKEIEDQKAAAGIFITLEPFSSPTAERVASGMADLKIGAMDYPRLQFWSIDLHFDNRPAKVPPMVNPLTGKEDSRQLQVL